MSEPHADDLLTDIRVALAPLRENADGVIADITARWKLIGDDQLSVQTVMGECPAWWSHLLSGHRASAACCQLALGFIALRSARIADARQLSHFASPLVSTETNLAAHGHLVAMHRRLQDRILTATREAVPLIQLANDAVDRGAFDVAPEIHERVRQMYRGDALPVYEIARTSLLRGLIDDDEYRRQMRLVLRTNPFFEQAMSHASTTHASAFRVRLRGWTHREDAAVFELADFAAGALDAGLGWWSAMAYAVLGYLDDALTDRLPEACRAAGVPHELVHQSPLAERAVWIQSLLRPPREHFSSTIRALDCAIAHPTPFDDPSPASSDDPRLDAMSEAARLVARSVDALANGDLPTADELARDALSTSFPNPVERAHALEVKARICVELMTLGQACSLFQECQHNQVLASATVDDQARVVTDLASNLMRIGDTLEARRAVTRSIDLLRSIGEPDPRRMIMSQYVYASCLAALGDLNGALGVFGEAESSRSVLPVEESISADLPGRWQVAQRLADDLRYRATSTHVDLVSAGGTRDDVIHALQEWLRLAEELRRSKRERDSIRHRLAAALAHVGRTPEAEALISDLSLDDPWLEARIAVSNGHLDRAANLLQRWIELSEKTGAADAQSQLKVLIALSQLRIRLGSHRAVDLLDQAGHIGFGHILGLGPADEWERSSAAALVSFAVSQLVEQAAVTGDRQTTLRAAESVINVKTLGPALSSLRFRTRDRSSTRETRQHLASRLSALALRGPSGVADDKILSIIQRIQSQYWQAQRQDRLPDTALPPWTTIDGIADGLAAGAAYVDIGLCLPPRDDVFVESIDDREVSVYAASIVTQAGLVDWQVLGAATSFDDLLSTFLFQARSVAELAAIPVLASAFAGQAASLCRRVWDQTIGRLAVPDEVTTIYLCCDGVLTTLPIECGLMPDGQYAVERFHFIHVLGPSELAFDRIPVARRPSDDRLEAVLIGAPDFGEHRPATQSPNTSAWRYPLRDELNELSWEALDGARAELHVIHKHFTEGTGRMLVGPDATKSALANVSRPRILHLATHAFFLNQSTMMTRDSSSGETDPGIDALPSLRSGLAMCAANSRRALTWTLPDDGIITALELSEVDLHDTELVVLSGCETARGGARIRETVNGLALACHLAGSRTVIASRWKVPDRPSSLLFDLYYQSLVDQRQTPEFALRNAMIHAIRFARTGDRPEFALPYSWGAWSLSISDPRSSTSAAATIS